MPIRFVLQKRADFRCEVSSWPDAVENPVGFFRYVHSIEIRTGILRLQCKVNLFFSGRNEHPHAKAQFSLQTKWFPIARYATERSGREREIYCESKTYKTVTAIKFLMRSKRVRVKFPSCVPVLFFTMAATPAYGACPGYRFNFPPRWNLHDPNEPSILMSFKS